MLTGLPYGAVGQDTAEYMLGNIVATVVFFESNGTIDPNTENWNPLVRDANGKVVFDAQGRTISASGPNRIEETKQRVIEGMEWWEQTLVNFYARMYDGIDPIHSVNFILDFDYAHNPINTGYEPISRRSNDHVLWIGDFLNQVGYRQTGWIDTDIRAFNHAQRVKHNADWAFTIFVANDYNDSDGRFAAGGTFSQAFAFAGGRFLVSPARRPASTFAHETGHIFYARDEYQFSGASYSDQRGYYNSQNWNAWDNPDPNYVRQPSLMDAGANLELAWQTFVSSDSSLKMIGWQDSDGNGVFDVLDVPLSLTGSGYYNPTTGFYRFVGHSAVNTLPNVNSAGRRNDITINRVSQLAYSLDDGATWIVAREYGGYEADIDVSIRIQPGQGILIRTQSIDPGTKRVVVTSQQTFRGSTAVPTSVEQPGIQGFVWYDKNGNAIWNPGEGGVPGWTVQIVDSSGQFVQMERVIEPDQHTQHALLNHALDGVILSAVGFDTKDARVGAVSSATPSTGDKVFGFVRFGPSDTWLTEWTSDSRTLRIDFANPITTLSIDAIGTGQDSYGRLEVYDAQGKLIKRYTTGRLQNGAVEAMTLSVPTPQIAYAIVRSTFESTIRLDNLRIGPRTQVTTDEQGAYSIKHLPQGTYFVQAVPTAAWEVAQPASGIVTVSVAADGTMAWEPGTARPSDFAGRPTSTAPPWRNPLRHLDVNDDGVIAPIDALMIINDLNRFGPRTLPPPTGGTVPPPYVDVNGDGLISAIDALWVINHLNRDGGSGEGDGGGDQGDGDRDGGGNGSPDGGEGEFVAMLYADPVRSTFASAGRMAVADACRNAPLVTLEGLDTRTRWWPGEPAERNVAESAHGRVWAQRRDRWADQDDLLELLAEESLRWQAAAWLK